MPYFPQFGDEIAESITDNRPTPPYPSDIRRAPAYVWESAPFLWQGPETEYGSNDARGMLDAIRRRDMERLGVNLNPWVRNKLGEN